MTTTVLILVIVIPISVILILTIVILFVICFWTNSCLLCCGSSFFCRNRKTSKVKTEKSVERSAYKFQNNRES